MSVPSTSVSSFCQLYMLSKILSLPPLSSPNITAVGKLIMNRMKVIGKLVVHCMVNTIGGLSKRHLSLLPSLLTESGFYSYIQIELTFLVPISRINTEFQSQS